MDTTINTFRQGYILHIEINRPERKNAISFAMYHAMSQAIEAAAEDSEVRVIFISGQGGCFTAGNDLEDFMQGPAMDERLSPVLDFMHALLACPKPVVAAVQGVAVGIGTTMLLHCDLVYAAENTLFKMPFVNLGLCPEFASSAILPAMVGHAKAAELLMLCEAFGSVEALQFGLVNQVLPESELLNVAKKKAEQLAKQPPEAVRATKALMRDGMHNIYRQIIAEEITEFKKGLESDAFRKVVEAFFAKK